MVQVIFSEAFLEDLSEQIDRIRMYRSEKSAKLLYESVYQVADRLKSNPAIGRKSATSGVRSVKAALEYRIYYEMVEKGTITLLSIFSTRANPEDNPYE